MEPNESLVKRWEGVEYALPTGLALDLKAHPFRIPLEDVAEKFEKKLLGDLTKLSPGLDLQRTEPEFYRKQVKKWLASFDLVTEVNQADIEEKVVAALMKMVLIKKFEDHFKFGMESDEMEKVQIIKEGLKNVNALSSSTLEVLLWEIVRDVNGKELEQFEEKLEKEKLISEVKELELVYNKPDRTPEGEMKEMAPEALETRRNQLQDALEASKSLKMRSGEHWVTVQRLKATVVQTTFFRGKYEQKHGASYYKMSAATNRLNSVLLRTEDNSVFIEKVNTERTAPGMCVNLVLAGLRVMGSVTSKSDFSVELDFLPWQPGHPRHDEVCKRAAFCFIKAVDIFAQYRSLKIDDFKVVAEHGFGANIGEKLVPEWNRGIWDVKEEWLEEQLKEAAVVAKSGSNSPTCGELHMSKWTWRLIKQGPGSGI